MKKTSKVNINIPEVAISLNVKYYWIIIAIFIAADAIGLAVEGISMETSSLWDMTWRVAALIALSLFYIHKRPDLRLATLAQAAAMFAAASTPICIFYYIATAMHRPLFDANLAAVDHALGLDWVAAYQWVSAHPLVGKILQVPYYSLLMQAFVIIFVLNFYGVTERCWELPWLFIIASLLLIPFSILWPAVGAFGFFHVNESESYVQIFNGLYNGTLKDIDLNTMQGIVQFPSFHAASAILLAYAARGTGILFPLFLLMNVLMFIATPPLGGHYFADVWGGILLALATIVLTRKYFTPLLTISQGADGAGMKSSDAVQR